MYYSTCPQKCTLCDRQKDYYCSNNLNVGEISNSLNKSTFILILGIYRRTLVMLFALNPIAGTSLFTCLLGGGSIDSFFKRGE